MTLIYNTLNTDLDDIQEKIIEGSRLDRKDGIKLFESSDILTIGNLANIVRERKNNNKTFYIINRHINYSNICKNKCKFCAFSREEGEEGAYQMSIKEILEKASQIIKEKATELHIVGGLHPNLGIDFYVEMISSIHKRFPEVHLQPFTAVEIAHFAEISGIATYEILKRLKDAGVKYSLALFRGIWERYSPDSEVKENMLADMKKLGFNPTMAFDDRSRVVDMWRDNGLRVFQVDKGDF